MAEFAEQPGPGGAPGPAIQSEGERDAPPSGSVAVSGLRSVAEQAETWIEEHETARDGLQGERARSGPREQRADHSASDLLRETVFDPVQDNAGPEKD